MFWAKKNRRSGWGVDFDLLFFFAIDPLIEPHTDVG